MTAFQQMFRLAIVALLLAPIGEASYRKHGEFKPADVQIEAAKFIKTAVEQHEWWPGRRILVRRTGMGLHFRRNDNGSFSITFDVSVQSKKERPVSSLLDGFAERKALASRAVQNPSFKWKLHEETRKAIEDIVNAPENGFNEFEVTHREVLSEPKGELIQSRTRVELSARTPEQALEFIVLYFSKFPEDTLLWEDDG